MREPVGRLVEELFRSGTRGGSFAARRRCPYRSAPSSRCRLPRRRPVERRPRARPSPGCRPHERRASLPSARCLEVPHPRAPVSAPRGSPGESRRRRLDPYPTSRCKRPSGRRERSGRSRRCRAGTRAAGRKVAVFLPAPLPRRKETAAAASRSAMPEAIRSVLARGSDRRFRARGSGRALRHRSLERSRCHGRTGISRPGPFPGTAARCGPETRALWIPRSKPPAGRPCRIACSVSTAEAPLNARFPEQHLVEHGSEGEDVRPMVRGMPLHLLGRHVAHRSHHDAGGGRGWRRRGLRQDARVSFGLRQLREAEIEDLGAAVLRRRRCSRVSGRGGRFPSRARPQGRWRSGRRCRPPCEVSVRLLRSRSRRVSPSSNSMTRRCLPPPSSNEWTAAMLG